MVKTVVGPEVQDRFERLAKLLPVPLENEQTFLSKWSELAALWEDDGFGIPPLLQFDAENEYSVRWPSKKKVLS